MARHNEYRVRGVDTLAAKDGHAVMRTPVRMVAGEMRPTGEEEFVAFFPATEEGARRAEALRKELTRDDGRDA